MDPKMPRHVRRAIRKGNIGLGRLWLNSRYGKWPKPTSPLWSDYRRRSRHR